MEICTWGVAPWNIVGSIGGYYNIVVLLVLLSSLGVGIFADMLNCKLLALNYL